MIIEGVYYSRFRVKWRTTNGQRRQRTILSPGFPWVRSEVCHMLDFEDVDVRRPVVVQAVGR